MQAVILSDSCSVCSHLPIGSTVCLKNKCTICINCTEHAKSMRTFNNKLCFCCYSETTTVKDMMVATKLPCGISAIISTIEEYEEHYDDCLVCIRSHFKTNQDSLTQYKKELHQDRDTILSLESQLIDADATIEEVTTENTTLKRKRDKDIGEIQELKHKRNEDKEEMQRLKQQHEASQCLIQRKYSMLKEETDQQIIELKKDVLKLERVCKRDGTYHDPVRKALFLDVVNTENNETIK